MTFISTAKKDPNFPDEAFRPPNVCRPCENRYAFSLPAPLMAFNAMILDSREPVHVTLQEPSR